MSQLISKGERATYTEEGEGLQSPLNFSLKHTETYMDTPSSAVPTAVPSEDTSLFITNPLRASLALVLGGSLSGHQSDSGGKMLTFRIEGAPPNFIQDHEAGRLCVSTDAIEQKFGFISNVIREHSRGLEARARANREALGTMLPGAGRFPAKSR